MLQVVSLNNKHEQDWEINLRITESHPAAACFSIRRAQPQGSEFRHRKEQHKEHEAGREEKG